jgi:hypothetical protein
MKKSLIAAAALAAVTLGAAGSAANAGVAGVGLNGVGVHADKSVAEHVYYKKRYYGHKHRKWVCSWRHGHRRCFWRTW